MTRRTNTDRTDAVAEQLTDLLDLISRVFNGADQGNAHYLHDKLGSLTRAAANAHGALSENGRTAPRFENCEWNPSLTIDPVRLRALLTRSGSDYRAGRALYPIGGDQGAAVAKATLDQAAAALEFGTPAALGLTAEQASAVAQWLRDRAPKRVTR